MTPSVEDFRRNVVDPALRQIDLWSPVASTLLTATALVESKLIHRKQIGGGPARGLFQIERATFDDVYGRYLKRKPSLLARVNELLTEGDPWANVEFNDRFACAIARCRYLYDPKPLPMDPDDLETLGAVWVRVYNAGGKGTVQKFVNAWRNAWKAASPALSKDGAASRTSPSTTSP